MRASLEEHEKWQATVKARIKESIKRGLGRLNSRFNPYGVLIESYSILEVKLPQQFVVLRENRTIFGVEIEVQKMKQVFDMHHVKNEEIMDDVRLEMKDKLLMEVVKGALSVAHTSKALQEVRATTAMIVAEQIAGEAAGVRLVAANGNLSVARLESERTQTLARMDAEARAKVEDIQAHTAAKVGVQRTEAMLAEAIDEAKGVEVVADAEGRSAKTLRPLRQMQLSVAQLRVFDEMSRNERLVIYGNLDNRDADDDLSAAKDPMRQAVVDICSANRSNPDLVSAPIVRIDVKT